MMNQSWRDAWWLVKFEFNKTKWSFLLLTLVLVVLTMMFATTLTDYQEDKVFIDLFFLGAVTMAPFMGRTKNFSLNRLYGDFWGSPYFNFLKQTPVSEKVLLRSRFLLFGCQSILLNFIILTLFYAFSTLVRESYSLQTYLIFSILWMIVGLITSSSIAAAEFGSEMRMWKIVFYCIVFYGGLFTSAVLYYHYTEFGVLGGFFYLSEHAPLMALLIGIVLLIMNFVGWKIYSVKIMHTVNYL
ncbi:hypothetical protein GCM10008967_17490 [Bacillus carboniphilus]|uniref:ABC-2 type transport system permease protein n=1 Tax=Bacillus carboniphilus TaxID=86663 RepID=A0ABN0W746_9BACI